MAHRIWRQCINYNIAYAERTLYKLVQKYSNIIQ